MNTKYISNNTSSVRGIDLNKSCPVAARGEFLIEPKIIIATGSTIPKKINITAKKFML